MPRGGRGPICRDLLLRTASLLETCDLQNGPDTGVGQKVRSHHAPACREERDLMISLTPPMTWRSLQGQAGCAHAISPSLESAGDGRVAAHQQSHRESGCVCAGAGTSTEGGAYPPARGTTEGV
jgi:hypothetical protein